MKDVWLAAVFLAAWSCRGTTEIALKPGDDLSRLNERICAAKADGARDVTVVLEDGSYALTEPIRLSPSASGACGRPTVLKARHRGRALVHGGCGLTDVHPLDGSRPENAAAFARLRPEARGHVFAGRLPGAGAVPGFAASGCAPGVDRRLFETPISLFEGGERLVCARWPRSGEWAKVVRPLVSPQEGVLELGVDAPLARWIGEGDLWAHGLWKFEWADAKCRVLEIDPAKRSLRVDRRLASFGFAERADYYVFNAVSEIAAPGDWVVDRPTRLVYVWPRQSVSDVICTHADHLIELKGVSHVRFEGLDFAYSREDAIVLSSCTNVSIVASRVRLTSGNGIDGEDLVRCRVDGCDFEFLGEGGVHLRGGDGLTLVRGDNTVENCHFRHYGQVLANYRPGIRLQGCGNSAVHNLIHHADHQAIGFNGPEMYFGWNVIHDVCQHNNDAGALYCCGQAGRGWTDMRGTLIEHNLIHNTGRLPRSEFCFALYFDDWSSGIRARWNIVNRADAGVYTCGCQVNVESNLFISCASALELKDRQWNADSKKGTNSPLWKRLSAHLASPAWRMRFGEAAELLRVQDPARPFASRLNRFVGNVEVGCGHDLRSDRPEHGNVVTNNLLLAEKTGFVDYARFDWRLAPEGEAYAALGENLGFSRMGLYESPVRFSSPVRFGDGLTPVRRPYPEWPIGKVGVQVRPVGKLPDGEKTFAADCEGCKPIPGFESILVCARPASADAWETCSFSFTPKFDLEARVHLAGTWGTDYTAYDDFRAEGCTVSDDLENGGEWRCGDHRERPQRNWVPPPYGLVDDAGRPFAAAKGHRFALAHLERHYEHRVVFRKGVRVTFSFQARAYFTLPQSPRS